MPMHKSTKNLSEIGKFFRNNDASSAMFNILRTINSLRLPEKVLFGRMDQDVTPAMTLRLKEFLPKASFKERPKSGHWPPMMLF